MAVADACLQVAAGEAVALTGPSASGKSTMLSMIGGLIEPDAGVVAVGGRDVFDRKRVELLSLRRSFGWVFQQYRLVSTLTALENVALALLPTARRREARRAASVLLDQVGLGEELHALPRDLSGGQQQRVAIARALATHPSVLLADEPTGALDRGTAGRILDLMFQLARREGMTLLLVTHDPAVAVRCDRLYSMEDGALKVTATPQ
jgi:putative ABC transport system ATP-binding protein